MKFGLAWFTRVWWNGFDWLHRLSYQLRGNKGQARFDTKVHPMEAKPRRFAYMAVLLSNDIRVVLFVNPANGDSWNLVLCSIIRAEVSRPSQNPSFQATQRAMFTWGNPNSPMHQFWSPKTASQKDQTISESQNMNEHDKIRLTSVPSRAACYWLLGTSRGEMMPERQVSSTQSIFADLHAPFRCWAQQCGRNKSSSLFSGPGGPGQRWHFFLCWCCNFCQHPDETLHSLYPLRLNIPGNTRLKNLSTIKHERYQLRCKGKWHKAVKSTWKCNIHRFAMRLLGRKVERFASEILSERAGPHGMMRLSHW